MNGNLKVIFHGDFSWDEMGMITLRHQTLRSMAGKIILNWGFSIAMLSIWGGYMVVSKLSFVQIGLIVVSWLIVLL